MPRISSILSNMQADSNTRTEPDPPVPDDTAFHDFDEAMNWLDQYFGLTNATNTVTDEPPLPAPPPQPQPIVIAVRDLIALPEDAVLVVNLAEPSIKVLVFDEALNAQTMMTYPIPAPETTF